MIGGPQQIRVRSFPRIERSGARAHTAVVESKGRMSTSSDGPRELRHQWRFHAAISWVRWCDEDTWRPRAAMIEPLQERIARNDDSPLEILTFANHRSS